VISFFACSDKLDQYYNLDNPANITTNKDTLIVRQNDFHNTNSNNGFFIVTATKGSFAPKSLFLIDSTNTLFFYLDSVEVKNNPINIEKPTSIFVASKKIGTYWITLKVLDIINKPSFKTIPVYVVENIIPIAAMSITITANGLNIDATASTSKYGKIRLYDYIIDGEHTVTTSAKIIKNITPGQHIISLITIDDLSYKSIMITKTITI
jgi:hypothetical protein